MARDQGVDFCPHCGLLDTAYIETFFEGMDMKWTVWLIIDLAILSLPISGLFSVKTDLSNMEYFFNLAWLAVGSIFVFVASWNVIALPFKKRISEEEKRTLETAEVVAKIVEKLSGNKEAKIEEFVLQTIVDILKENPDRFEVLIDQVSKHNESNFRLLSHINKRQQKHITPLRDFYVDGETPHINFSESKKEIRQLSELAARFKPA